MREGVLVPYLTLWLRCWNVRLSSASIDSYKFFTIYTCGKKTTLRHIAV